MRLCGLLLAAATATPVLHAQDADPVRPCVVRVEATDEGLLKALALKRENAPAAELKKIRIFQRFRLVASGVVVSPEGEIVTAAVHPKAPLRLEVTFADGSTARAEVVGTDPFSNLALIRVPGPLRHYLRLEEDDVVAGEPMRAVGHEVERPVTMRGSVAREGLTVAVRDLYGVNRGQPFRLASVFIIGAPEGRANPGSVCVDDRGRFAGIVLGAVPQGTMPSAEEPEKYCCAAFATPAWRVARIVRSLREHKRVVRAYFGMHLVPASPALQAQFDLPRSAGSVYGVEHDSPADKAGVRHYDVVLSVNGKSYRDTYHLDQAMADLAPGTPAELRVLRKGKPLVLTATPIER